MSTYLDPARFILAGDLMREIMTALAEGHAALVNTSRSPLGTLVVKGAEVAVSFDFSVQARETQTGFALQVRPPLGGGFGLGPALETKASEQTTEIINRATIRLEIVNVVSQEKTAVRDERPPRDDTPPIDREPDSPPPGLADAEVIKVMRAVWEYLSQEFPAAAKVLKTHLDEVRARLEAGELDKARRGVAAFVADVRLVHEQQGQEVPDAVATALDRLAAWAGTARPAADSLRLPDRERIATLASLLAEAQVDAPVRRAFAAQAEKAIATGRGAAARAVLAHALAELAPHLPGRVLPVPFLDHLEKLGLLGVLETTDGTWRAPFDAALARLQALADDMPLPRRAATAFGKGVGRVRQSQSAVEAGSRLVRVLDALREATDALDVPHAFRDTLRALGRPGIA